jgi:O-antigen/teichoic acid export membrane protein
MINFKEIFQKQSVIRLFQDELFKNSFYIMASTITMAAFGFFFWLIAAHLYHPNQVGIASTLVSSMIFISYLSLLGFNNTILKFLPLAKKRHEHINTSVLLVTGAALIISLLFVIIGPLFAPKLSLLHHGFYGVGFILLCVGAVLNLVTDSIYIALRSAKYNFVIDGLMNGAVQLILPFAVLFLGSYGIFTAQGGSTFIATVLSFYFLYKKFGYKPSTKIDRSVVSDIFHYSAFSYFGNVLSILPTIVLPIVVLNRLGSANAGYYYLAYMMANVLFSLGYAVSQSLFAEGAYAEQELINLTKRAARYLTLTIVPAAILLATVGPFVLSIFGKSYSTGGHNILLVFAVTAPFLAVYSVGNVILSVQKRMKTALIINVIYALTVCISAYMLAPRGVAWASSGWLIGNVIGSILMITVLGYEFTPVAKLQGSRITEQTQTLIEGI